MRRGWRTDWAQRVHGDGHGAFGSSAVLSVIGRQCKEAAEARSEICVMRCGDWCSGSLVANRRYFIRLGRRLTVAPTSAAVRDVTMSRGQRGAPPTRERSGGHSWQREGTSSPHLPAVLGVHRDKTPTALAMAHVDPRWRCSGGRVWCLVFAEGFGLRHEARHHCR